MVNIKDTIIHMLCGKEIEIKDVENLIKTYGKNIEKADETTGKKVILLLKEIIDSDDEDTLKILYERYKEKEKFDLKEIENELKQYYGEKLMIDLYKPIEKDLISQNDLPEELKKIDVPVYNAGTDFRMMLSARGDGYNR